MSNSDIFRCYFSDLKAAALCLGPSQLYIACDIAEGRERERERKKGVWDEKDEEHENKSIEMCAILKVRARSMQTFVSKTGSSSSS